MSTPRSVAFHTLGCKLNYSETSSISRLFESEGYAVVPFEGSSDIYVINTCSVTDFADKKCRQVVRKVQGHNPDALVVMIGCYAQLKPEEISNIPGVDLVLGAAEKFRIVDYINSVQKIQGQGVIHASHVLEANTFESSFSFGDRTRSFLKVQDGCNYKCTFCTIPQARGKSRSDTVEQVVDNAKMIAKMGAKEIVLTGVNLGDFGNGTEVIEGTKPKKEALFIDLIRELDKIDSVDRFRISSIEPNLTTDEVIDFVSNSNRFMPHFHMPLQSGNNKQLKAMKRRYLKELYQERVEHIKSVMPHACIGVDVIVGFPGETKEDFLETYEFIRSLDVSYLHVFTYSERPNTPAFEMEGIVDMGERRRRNKMLRILSEKKKRAFYEQFIGLQREVIWEESKKEGMISGWTDNYIKIEAPGTSHKVNTKESILIGQLTDEGLASIA